MTQDNEKLVRELNELLKSINEFDELRRKEKLKLPYHLNLLDEISANENAHSRILLKLLNYSNEQGYVFLQSFVNLLSIDEKCNVESPVIDFNKEYIDGLISENGKYAIIIENKIHNATDQYAQIETYIERVIKQGLDSTQVFVVYLTRDGVKTISESSLTTKAKERLEYKSANEAGRYITINYKEHILPWLTDEILLNCKLKEEWLISSIQQYIDHLEGMYYQRKNERVMNEIIMDFVKSKVTSNNNNDVDTINNLMKMINQVTDFQDALVNYRSEIFNKQKIIQNQLSVKLNELAEINGLDFMYKDNSVNDNKGDAFFYFSKKDNRNLEIKFWFKAYGYIDCWYVVEKLNNYTQQFEHISTPAKFKFSNWDDQLFIAFLAGDTKFIEVIEAFEEVLIRLKDKL